MKLPLSLAATALLAACASPHAPMDQRSRATCDSNPCLVKVVVRACNNIRADPKILDVPAGNRNDIVWEIHQDPGLNYVFTRHNGIEWKSGSGGGFSPGGGGGSIRYRWHNNHSGKADHHYNIHVTRDNGATICTEDPTIVNH